MRGTYSATVAPPAFKWDCEPSKEVNYSEVSSLLAENLPIPSIGIPTAIQLLTLLTMPLNLAAEAVSRLGVVRFHIRPNQSGGSLTYIH